MLVLMLSIGFTLISSISFLPLLPAMALPLEDAKKKLDTIAVYVAMQPNQQTAQLLFSDSIPGKFTAPLFQSKQEASLYLQGIQKEDPTLKAELFALSLYKVIQLVDELRNLPQNKDKEIVAPLISSEKDRLAAEAILLAQGETPENIKKGLQVPIFFSEPMVVAETSSGKKQLFFLSYDQLKAKIQANPIPDQTSLKYKVADLNAVIEMIKNEDQDIFAFYPNPLFVELNPSVIAN